MRSLVMRDLETGSEWSHLLGASMAGKLKGQTLKPLITDMVTWEAWKAKHPDSTVLNMSNTSREYTRDFYRNPKQFVYGFEVGDQAYLLPMEKMQEHSVHSFELSGVNYVATFDKLGAATYLFASKLDDKLLEFQPIDERLVEDLQTGSHWDRSSGTAVAGELTGAKLTAYFGMMSYRTAWLNFHPKSIEIQF